MKSFGFTLIELLITIAIAAVVLGLAVPNAVQMVRNNQLVSVANDLVSTLHFARSEAIRRGIPIGVCSSADAKTCSGSGEWSEGWIAWVDNNGDDNVNGQEEIVFIMKFSKPAMSLINTDGINRLRYAPNGYLAVAPGTNVDFNLCDSRSGETGRRIQINATGSPRVNTLPCS